MLRLAFFTLALVFSSSAVAADVDQPVCRPDETVVLAAEDGFFPYTGLFEGDLRGFSFDIVSAAYDAVGCHVEIVHMPYSRCIREIQAGRHDGCFNTTNSTENKLKYFFHEKPLFRGRILVYGASSFDGPFITDAFATATFSVVRGYTYTDEFDNNTAIKKIEVESDLQTLALVARGRADFAVVYEKVAQFHIGNNSNRISPAPKPVAGLADFDLFVSFSKAFVERSVFLAHALDIGLDRIRGNGVYGRIESAWDAWLKVGIREGKPAPHWTANSS